MNVQSFRHSTPKLNLPGAKSQQGPQQPDGPKCPFHRMSQASETFEIVGSAVVAGLVCGLSANSLGAGWGSVAGVAGSTVGMGAYSYATSKDDGYKKLNVLAGGISGLVMGGVGAAGAALGAATGHPIIGGLVAGGLFAAYGAIKQNS